jgi:hypothetical protein
MVQKLTTTPVTPGLEIEEVDPFAPVGTPAAPTVETREVDPLETVKGQMTGLLSSEDPYIRSAGQTGVEDAQKRGLLSSSIATGAVERERIKAALPIAQQDAATQFQQRKAEQAQEYALQGQAQEAGIKQSLMQAEQGQQLERMREDAAIRGQMLDLDSQVRERLSGIEQGYALELEGLKQDYEIIKNKDTQMGAMYSDALKSIATFMDDPDMSAAQQKTGLNMIISNLQSGLRFMSGITSVPGAATMGESAALDEGREAIPGQEKSDLELYQEHQASGSDLSLEDWTETNYPNRLSDYEASIKAKQEAAAAEQEAAAAESARYEAYLQDSREADAAGLNVPTYEEWKRVN